MQSINSFNRVSKCSPASSNAACKPDWDKIFCCASNQTHLSLCTNGSNKHLLLVGRFLSFSWSSVTVCPWCHSANDSEANCLSPACNAIGYLSSVGAIICLKLVGVSLRKERCIKVEYHRAQT